MTAAPPTPERTTHHRRVPMLRTAMGPVIAAAREDPD
ncbi:MAG: P-type conjugative transfer ATPase TrbB, partial [Variovorax sp.]|nr:P-type conjugative transfer ATPase TrbB [Variovorax sp.]